MKINNKILLIIFSLGLLIAFTGCEEQVLDKEPRDFLSETAVWDDINLVQMNVNTIYHGLAGGEWGKAITGTVIFMVTIGWLCRVLLLMKDLQTGLSVSNLCI